MRRGDRAMLIIAASVSVIWCLVWAAGYFRAASGTLTATIMQDGKILRMIPLKKDDPAYEIMIEHKNGYNRLRVGGGSIVVTEADCPDKDCVKRGPLQRPGDSAVCLPHRLLIRLSGESGTDGVTW